MLKGRGVWAEAWLLDIVPVTLAGLVVDSGDEKMLEFSRIVDAELVLPFIATAAEIVDAGCTEVLKALLVIVDTDESLAPADDDADNGVSVRLALLLSVVWVVLLDAKDGSKVMLAEVGSGDTVDTSEGTTVGVLVEVLLLSSLLVKLELEAEVAVPSDVLEESIGKLVLLANEVDVGDGVDVGVTVLQD